VDDPRGPWVPPPPVYPPPVYPPPSRARRYGLIAVAGALLSLAMLATVTYLVVHRQSGTSAGDTYAGSLRTPMQLRPVQAEQAAPCAVGQSPSSDARMCYSLGTGFTVTAVRKIHLDRRGQITPVLSVTLLAADAARFGRLTQAANQAYQQDPNAPGREIGVVVNGQVVMAPQISSPILGGSFDISAGGTQLASLELLLHQLSGH